MKSYGLYESASVKVAYSVPLAYICADCRHIVQIQTFKTAIEVRLLLGSMY
jgi:hypothetical protein